MPKAAEAGPVGGRVRQIRENRQMELAQLAEEVDESPDYLARLEKGEFNPPVALILRLAQALRVDSMVLLREAPGQGAPRPSQEAASKKTAKYEYELLAPEQLQKHLKSFMVNLEPRTGLDGPAYRHEGEEYHYVLEGELKVLVGEETHELSQGQSLYFDSSQMHQLFNPGEVPCRVLVVVYTP